MYNNDPVLGEEFNALVRKIHNSYNHLDYFIERDKPYNPVGRFQTEEESDNLSREILNLVRKDGMVAIVSGNQANYDFIVEEILTVLHGYQREDEC